MPKSAQRSRLSLVGAVAITTAAALLLTGCHSNSSSGAAATTAAPGAASAGLAGASTPAAAQQSSSASIGGSAKASCKQLTDAEVQPLTIDKIVKDDITSANMGDGNPGQQCVFSGADGAGSVDVLVIAGPQAAPGYASDIAGYSDGVVAVPGIGDQASREKGDGQVVSLKGDVYCSVSLGSGDQVPGLGPLMEAAGGTTHIDESAYQTTAEALGTLCNRIYGSGNTTPDLSSLIAADAAASASAAASAGPASQAAAASS